MGQVRRIAPGKPSTQVKGAVKVKQSGEDEFKQEAEVGFHEELLSRDGLGSFLDAIESEVTGCLRGNRAHW